MCEFAKKLDPCVMVCWEAETGHRKLILTSLGSRRSCGRRAEEALKPGDELSLLCCVVVHQLLSGLGDVLLLCGHRCCDTSGVLMGRKGFTRVVVLI